MFGIGMTELMVILVIGLVVIGPKKLPGLARSLGKSLAEFRRASDDMRREFLDVAQSARIDPEDIDEPPDVSEPSGVDPPPDVSNPPSVDPPQDVSKPPGVDPPQDASKPPGVDPPQEAAPAAEPTMTPKADDRG